MQLNSAPSLGITPVVDFIVGFPFETDEDQTGNREPDPVGGTVRKSPCPPVHPLARYPARRYNRASTPEGDGKSLRKTRFGGKNHGFME